MAREHVVFLAFADARGDLAELREEIRRLQALFERFRDDGRCSLIFKPAATWEQIYEVLTTRPDDIAIFHFGGHAQEGQVLLDSHLGAAPVGGEGLASLLGRRRNLKLAFLNGCSTRPQVQSLLDAGVPAVIATARPIEDRAAREIAVAFYEALTAGGEAVPAGGRSLRAAFDAAHAFVLGRTRPDGRDRDLIPANRPQAAHDVTDEHGLPWGLFVRNGAEQVERWDLFTDDPLFGLPALPADIGWPVEPYRNLVSFEREHARIFFGRGRAIRELYGLLTLPAGSADSRLIFYYGQTGVGKTSVLAAGLLPRLESAFATRYCRRSAQAGLLGTLRDELAPSTGPFDLGAAWMAAEREVQRPLLVVLDQAEESFTKPLAEARPRDEVRALFEAVSAAFAPALPDRPGGRLILGFRKEWLAEFNEIRKESNLDIKSMMLDPLDHPGVVEAIEGPSDHFGLVIKPDRNSVQAGETTMAEFMSHDLFDTLADPQTEQESPIAPTLQILLTRMWNEASKRLPGRPTFDRALYQDLKGKGFKLDEVIQEQFGKIAEVDDLGQAVEKGLLLDLLEFFTTHEGTADTHTRKQVHERYKHQPAERLNALLEACQSRYLLADVGLGVDCTTAYRLTHDTLAPLLRERFRVSPDAAQRARHALEGRAATWKGHPTGPLLDRVDLASVEGGRPWMRALEEDEPALLVASQEAERRRVDEEAKRQHQLGEAKRRIQQVTRIGLGVSLILLIVAVWGWFTASVQTEAAKKSEKFSIESAEVAKKQTKIAKAEKARADEKAKIAESRRLASLSDSVRPNRLDQAMLLALEAYSVETPEARRSLFRCIDDCPEVLRFLDIPQGGVTSVAFGPGDTLAVGYSYRGDEDDRGGVLLFDANGEKLSDKPSRVDEGGVTSVAFGPEGTIAAGYSRRPYYSVPFGFVVLDSEGKRLRDEPIEVKDEGDEARKTALLRWGKYYGINSVALIPYTRVVYGQGGTKAMVSNIVDRYGSAKSEVALFDAKGDKLAEPHVANGGAFTSVAFSTKGTVAVGFARRGGSGEVVLFDAKENKFRDQSIEIHEGYVTSVAFGPGDTLAVGFAPGAFDPQDPLFQLQGFATKALQGDHGGVVLFNAKGEKLGYKPIEVKGSSITSVAISSGGIIAAGFARGFSGSVSEGGVVLLDTKRDRLMVKIPEAQGRRDIKVASGPEGTVAVLYARGSKDSFEGAGLELFNAKGKKLRDQPIEINDDKVMSVAFGPGDTIAAGLAQRAGGCRMVVFDAEGTKLRDTPITNVKGYVGRMAFGAGDTIAVAEYLRSSDGLVHGGVVLLDAKGKRLWDAPMIELFDLQSSVIFTSVAIGPTGTIAAVYTRTRQTQTHGGGFVLLDATGKRLTPEPIQVKRGAITSVAFSLGGTIAVGGHDSDIRKGEVFLFGARGERLGTIEINEGGVTSVAFGPGDTLAVGYSVYHRLGGVVLLDARVGRLRDRPIEINKGGVDSVSFGPGGTLVAAYTDDDGEGMVFLDGDPKSWQAKLKKVVNRNFTWTEWREYFSDTPYHRTICHLPLPYDLPYTEVSQPQASENLR
jgi:WD40 repeat protein